MPNFGTTRGDNSVYGHFFSLNTICSLAVQRYHVFLSCADLKLLGMMIQSMEISTQVHNV